MAKGRGVGSVDPPVFLRPGAVSTLRPTAISARLTTRRTPERAMGCDPCSEKCFWEAYLGRRGQAFRADGIAVAGRSARRDEWGLTPALIVNGEKRERAGEDEGRGAYARKASPRGRGSRGDQAATWAPIPPTMSPCSTRHKTPAPRAADSSRPVEEFPPPVFCTHDLRPHRCAHGIRCKRDVYICLLHAPGGLVFRGGENMWRYQ